MEVLALQTISFCLYSSLVFQKIHFPTSSIDNGTQEDVIPESYKSQFAEP